eukprot:5334881-Pyramimonas_sp.AAC.1
MHKIEFSTVFMLQEGYQAGTPAGGSDGSWIQARSADVIGAAPSGITPTDMLCANDAAVASTRRATCVVCTYE